MKLKSNNLILFLNKKEYYGGEVVNGYIEYLVEKPIQNIKFYLGYKGIKILKDYIRI
jgi:hypothetical protein